MTTSPPPTTEYAPASRSDAATLERQRRLVAGYCGPAALFFDSVSELILVVNQDRQIVYFNSHVPTALGVECPARLYGLRPGEALNCRGACVNPGGCGTSEFCSQCGAVDAILSSLNNVAELRECSVLKQDGAEAFDLLVRTTPLPIDGQMFSIVAITDISHEKRRRSLERIFFHDVMNTALGLDMMAQLLQNEPAGPQAEECRQSLARTVKQLIGELKSQKELLAAENNELQPVMKTVDATAMLREIVDGFASRHADHRIVLAESAAASVPFRTDAAILGRVIGNMVQNAIEASRPGQPITVDWQAADGHIEFRVHNQAFIPRPVQLQLFQRSFSTKGAGRGLGTYSMKLLSERYLGGAVECRSSLDGGTTFTARYPLA